MRKIEEFEMYVEISGKNIIVYDYMQDCDEADYETGGILTELDEDLADRVESVLLIKSVEDYQIKRISSKLGETKDDRSF